MLCRSRIYQLKQAFFIKLSRPKLFLSPFQSWLSLNKFTRNFISKPVVQPLNIRTPKNRSKLLSIINQNDKINSFKEENQIKKIDVPEISEKWELSGQDTQSYTSKHFRLRPGEVENFLTTHGLIFKLSNEEIVVKYWPLCTKPHKNEATNMWTLNIESHIGVFNCFRWGMKGSWFDFKRLVSGNMDPSYLTRTVELSAAYASENTYNNLDIDIAYTAFVQLYSTDNEVIDYLTRITDKGRGIHKEILKFYRVGMKVEKFRQADGTYDFEDCVSFPIYGKWSNKKKDENVKNELYNKDNLNTAENIINHNPEYEIIKLKYRSIYEKSKQRFYPSGMNLTGLFGLNTVPKEAKVLVITEGEFDAMAVYQATGIPTVSLPNGVHSLPPQILPWLEGFERIYLWLDNDQAGQASWEVFANKLGKMRTFIVKAIAPGEPSYKDANEALIAGADLNKYIKRSRWINEENILRISDMSESILSKLLNFDEQKGVQSGYFKWYNNLIKGFRRGELTVFTGPTGSGKTTFLSQLSLDFLERQIPTLWGSFEIKNEILATTLMYQYSRQNLEKIGRENLKIMLEDMSDLPLYFMKFFGSTDLNVLFNTLDYAVYTYDIAHIVLDNLQFMLSGQGRNVNKFDLQDQVISELRRFCTEKNVHITIVIHPKKVDDDEELTIASVFGSAKATQESDNIIIMQNKHRFRYIDIRKNRFDGSIGRVPIGFDRSTRRYFELFKKEEEAFYRENISIKDIIKNRIQEYGTVEPYLNEAKDSKDNNQQKEETFIEGNQI